MEKNKNLITRSIIIASLLSQIPASSWAGNFFSTSSNARAPRPASRTNLLQERVQAELSIISAIEELRTESAALDDLARRGVLQQNDNQLLDYVSHVRRIGALIRTSDQQNLNNNLTGRPMRHPVILGPGLVLSSALNQRRNRNVHFYDIVHQVRIRSQAYLESEEVTRNLNVAVGLATQSGPNGLYNELNLLIREGGGRRLGIVRSGAAQAQVHARARARGAAVTTQPQQLSNLFDSQFYMLIAATEGETCPISIGESPNVEVSCGHRFDQKSIKQWYESSTNPSSNHKKCPICRKPLAPIPLQAIHEQNGSNRNRVAAEENSNQLNAPTGASSAQ